MRDWQRLDRRVGRHGEVQAREKRARAVAHRRLAQRAETAGELAAGEDVAGDGEIRKEQHLLVDEADAARERVARRRERNGLPAKPQLTAVGLKLSGKNLEQ